MRTIIVNTPGPQGPQGSTGPTGSQGPSVPFTNLGNNIYATTSSIIISGSLDVSGSITSSLFGTSSWATNALTASSLLGSVISASFASTASFYSGPTTTTFVGNCNSFSIPNGSLVYGAYLVCNNISRWFSSWNILK